MSRVDRDDRHSRPLADDPSFLASLSELDEGLSGEDAAPRVSFEPPSPPPAPSPFPPPFPPPFASPESASLASPPLLPAVVTAPGRRPLLELFPPAPQQWAPAVAVPSYQPMRSSALGTLGEPAAPASERLTYETFYGLRERPFGLSSDLKFLYHSSEYDRVTQQMLGAIGRRDGIVALTGELGVGKTTLCRALVEQLDRRMLTSFVSEPFTSIGDLLRTVLVDFGVMSRHEAAGGRLQGSTDAELSNVLRDFLSSLAPLQAFAIVIIDEAQNLPAHVLNDIGALSDARREDGLMQIVLVGQPSLLATLGQAASREFGQRIALKCRLGPLAADEIGGFVMHRLRVAGDSPRVDFDDQAIAKVYELSGGLPRLVNLLCDRALAGGFSESASAIDESMVDRAADDLDLAPPMAPGFMARIAAGVAVLVILAFCGAAAGAYVFRADLHALAIAWEAAPAPPRPPRLPVATPYAPPTVAETVSLIPSRRPTP